MIAIAGPDLPHEVLLAAGCHAGPLAFDPARSVDRASRWLESKFFPWAPPVLESWAEGAYDGLEKVLFSRADDTSQRLYYYICELQRRGLVGGPEPAIFDVAKIPRASSRNRVADKVRALAGSLGVDDEALEAAIRTANAARTTAPARGDGPTCLVAGSPPPDRRLHAAVEAAGFTPVCRTLAESWMDPGAAVAEGTGDPASAIATKLHAEASGPRSFADPAELLSRRIDDCAAAAVIVWRIEEDEAQTWHLPAERRLLADRSIPHLVLTRRDWLARDGVADEIAEFLERIRA